MIVGIQIFFSSFLLAILGLRRQDRSERPRRPGRRAVGRAAARRRGARAAVQRRRGGAHAARGTGQGALASLSEDGSPWSSFVAYGTLADGSPVLCVSHLAEHGRNLPPIRVPRCSSSLPPTARSARGRAGDAGRRGAGRGDATPAQAYVAGRAAGEVYVDFGDFTSGCCGVERVRWVGGYGRMGSGDAEAYAAAEPDPVAPSAPRTPSSTSTRTTRDALLTWRAEARPVTRTRRPRRAPGPTATGWT